MAGSEQEQESKFSPLPFSLVGDESSYDPENPPFILVDFVPPEDFLWVPPPEVPEKVVQSMPDDSDLDEKIELIWGDLPKDEQPNHKRARAAINFRRRKIYEKWLLHKSNIGNQEI